MSFPHCAHPLTPTSQAHLLTLCSGTTSLSVPALEDETAATHPSQSCQAGVAAAPTGARGLLPGLYFSTSHHITPVMLTVTTCASWGRPPSPPHQCRKQMQHPKFPYLSWATVTEHQPAPGACKWAASHVSLHPFRKELVQEPGLIQVVCAALTLPELCNYLISVIP